MSLKLPLKALPKGVRMARVITTSSAFFDVLRALAHADDVSGRGTYIALSPEEPGVRCLNIELSLSAAILDIV